jgi:hypothetical protein
MKQNMSKKLVTIAIGLLAIGRLMAQDETDVFRFAQTQSGTTARSIGIGGALGSIGADFGAILVNPATIGRYSKSEITLTPSLNFMRTPSTFNFTENDSNGNSKFNMQNIGLVTASNINKRSKWRNSAFALGVNKVATFNRDYFYRGSTDQSSYTDAVANRINNNGGMNYLNSGVASVEDIMFYNSGVIDVDTNNPGAVRNMVNASTGIRQSKDQTDRGAINEINLGIGGNYDDVLYIGGSIGLPILTYKSTTAITEVDESGNTNNNFNYMQQMIYRTTTGAGFNAKLGAVILPRNSNVRLGLAYHTPTWYALEDEYIFTMRSDVENLFGAGNGVLSQGEDGTNADNTLISGYSIRTAGKVVGSASYIFGRSGFLTADIEHVGYNKMRIRYDGDAQYSTQITNVVAQQHANAINVRLGAEVRVNQFSYRAGGAFNGNPYGGNSNYGNASSSQISLGAGFRSTSFFVDVALAVRRQTTREFIYVVQNSGNLNTPATVNRNSTLAAATIGWKF